MPDIAAARGIVIPPAYRRTRIRPKLAGDELIQRGLLGLVMLYLVVALVLPLSLVGMKALQTFHFPLQQVSVEFRKDGAWTPQGTLADWALKSGFVQNPDLMPSERSRIEPAAIIPNASAATSRPCASATPRPPAASSSSAASRRSARPWRWRRPISAPCR
nr:hypothetical protein [Shinella zoogloeoides]